jgi:hypothetical protein
MLKPHTTARVVTPAVRHFRPRLELLEDRSVPALVVNDLTGGLTPQALAQSLVGSGVTISNVTYTGNNFSSGEFSGGTGILGFESGVVLSTGHAKGIVGPNVDNTGLGTPDFNNGLPGDPQLAALAGTTLSNTFDATALEFDFVPIGDTVTFNYVFGSEEYNEFVANGFNDVFGLFVNGTNVALVPGTNTPVGVDTVNDGNPTVGAAPVNPQFYINNAISTANNGDPLPATPPLLNTDLDGLTVVLTATAHVTPGVTNHIKLAIADTGDAALDSDVMIQSGSLTSPPFPQLLAFRPFRYAFRSLEQNEGLQGPLPLQGPAGVPTFDGYVTVINIGNGAAFGPVQVGFHDLPQGVQLVNATGIDPNTGDPFIIFPVKDIPANDTLPLRIPVKFTNPLNQPLGTFFIAPYFVDVTSS